MLLRKRFFAWGKTIAKPLSTAPLENVQTKPTESIISGNPKLSEVLQHPDYFNVHDLFTIKDLFDKRVHYGHKVTSLNPKMQQYLFGSRLGHLIFDLDKTAIHLRKALNFAAHIAYQNGIVLFLSRNSSFTLMVEKTAAECKEYAITRHWRLGTFTDSEKVFRGVIRLPDLCIFLNTLEENGHQHLGVKEAAKMFIPTIGIVDTNCDPDIITYPVPGNDDTIETIAFYCHLFKSAILRGKAKRLEHMKSDKDNSSELAPS